MATPTNPYSSQAISGYNSFAPADDGTKTDSNRVQWQKHLDKIGDPLKALAEDINSAITSAFNAIVMTSDAAEEDVIVTMEEFT
ncbi:hypothetical protein LCGC14_3111900 [marine sediment metagenome]|uniref:Uncharacterized protein n=1 Tax=marine sediment metagenome TaxID=412755 RepID=A0A0F8WTR6_9ZZZZ